MLWFKHGASLFAVDEGSEPHKRLREVGAQRVDGPDAGGYAGMKVPELHAIVKERGLDVSADAKKAELVDALEADDASSDTLD
jgi:hypothetical protein